MVQMPIPILVVVGPTASGKTDLAVELALKNNGEIISFDSMQIYRDAPIATAVPTLEEKKGVPHHLMSFLSSDERFSVAQYTDLAHQVILEVFNRGKLPVLVGGTGLYYSSLLDHLQFSRESDATLSVRKRLQQRLDTEGIESLYRELKEIDPQAAEKIHINNHIRVIRALEIYLTTGETMTQQNQRSRDVPSPYSPCVIGLNYRDRERLYQRINLRVHKMIEAGLVEEVTALYQKNPTGTLMQAIGVKEFAPYFLGEASLEDVIESIQTESRHYAKRQLTWFRRDPRVQWLYKDDSPCEAVLLNRAQAIVSDFLSSKQ